MNVWWINNRLLLGSSPETPLDITLLRDSAKITHVIDVRAEFDDSSLFPPDTPHPFQGYLWNGMKDDPWPTWTPKPKEWYGRSLAFAMAIWGIPDARLFVHCALGVNRSVATEYCILRAMGWPKHKAAALIIEQNLIEVASASIWQAGDIEAALKSLGWTSNGH